MGGAVPAMSWICAALPEKLPPRPLVKNRPFYYRLVTTGCRAGTPAAGCV